MLPLLGFKYIEMKSTSEMWSLAKHKEYLNLLEMEDG